MFISPLTVVLIVCILVKWLGDGRVATSKSTETGSFSAGIESGRPKNRCTTTKTYCFSSADCRNMCAEDDSFTCSHGTCENDIRVLQETNSEAEPCDPKMGMVTFLVGDTAFGRYTRICKSVDPGIAVSSGKNLMCLNGEISINYTRQFPNLSTCKNCTNPIEIPATSTKRRHVECNNPLYDMVIS